MIVNLSKHFGVLHKFQYVACYIIVQVFDIYIKNNKMVMNNIVALQELG